MGGLHAALKQQMGMSIFTFANRAADFAFALCWELFQSSASCIPCVGPSGTFPSSEGIGNERLRPWLPSIGERWRWRRLMFNKYIDERTKV